MHALLRLLIIASCLYMQNSCFIEEDISAHYGTTPLICWALVEDYIDEDSCGLKYYDYDEAEEELIDSLLEDREEE